MSKRIENKDEEIVYEEGVDETHPSSDLQKKMEKLKKDLKKCQEEKQEYLDGWQRSKADFVNFKQQTEKAKKDYGKFAIEDFVIEILPTLDSFDLAFKNKDLWEQIDKNWRTGIEFIYSQLKNTLEKRGITEINPLNEKFDHNKHHSVATVNVESEEDDDRIIEVIQKGYVLDGKIIRHPNVKVGKFGN